MKDKEIEVKELLEIISQVKSNNLDLEKLYDVSRIKIEAVQLREERDELKMRLNDVDGAHQLLEGIFFKEKDLKFHLFDNFLNLNLIHNNTFVLQNI